MTSVDGHRSFIRNLVKISKNGFQLCLGSCDINPICLQIVIFHIYNGFSTFLPKKFLSSWLRRRKSAFPFSIDLSRQRTGGHIYAMCTIPLYIHVAYIMISLWYHHQTSFAKGQETWVNAHYLYGCSNHISFIIGMIWSSACQRFTNRFKKRKDGEFFL